MGVSINICFVPKESFEQTTFEGEGCLEIGDGTENLTLTIDDCTFLDFTETSRELLASSGERTGFNAWGRIVAPKKVSKAT